MRKAAPAKSASTGPSTRAPFSDHQNTVADLKRNVEAFVEERDWAQFHSPKNLAMAIGVEAAELMEIFRWESDTGSSTLVKKRPYLRAIEEELADVVICCLSFANRTGIDLSKAVRQKLCKNRRKYPVRRFKGRSRIP